jgi:hypothetical protein
MMLCLCYDIVFVLCCCDLIMSEFCFQVSELIEQPCSFYHVLALLLLSGL